MGLKPHSSAILKFHGKKGCIKNLFSTLCADFSRNICFLGINSMLSPSLSKFMSALYWIGRTRENLHTLQNQFTQTDFIIKTFHKKMLINFIKTFRSEQIPILTYLIISLRSKNLNFSSLTFFFHGLIRTESDSYRISILPSTTTFTIR